MTEEYPVHSRTLMLTIAQIGTLDVAAAEAARRRQQMLTKPPEALGRLEELSVQLAGITGEMRPPLRPCHVLVCAGDHGVAAEGVSAYPSAVTAQMVANFLAGGAAINVLARQVGAEVVVVDAGVAGDLPDAPNLYKMKVRAGTANFAHEPAMSPAEAQAAVEAGIAAARRAIDAGARVLATGDMGIGNTTASSAVVCALTGSSPLSVVGRGTGIDDIVLARKRDAVQQGLDVNLPDRRDGLDVLAKVGGFEIGALAGVILGGASRRVPVVLDGFITGAAALVADALSPRARDAMIASHRSVEIGHRAVFDHLELEPLLDLELRLGEGTG
ncbi:MAG: nicotinate-nucleotide--dimethylbenzimidazole phosphoribosyltransferase, partial [Hyphomicrobiaceae bacterium]|nr:nicotinate-nucleotide--dimethylbenzimidazole phosphoribosyltransferase [Hyphomicrobiaceae bacterium]